MRQTAIVIDMPDGTPGYTIEGHDFRGWDFWVTLPGAPAVDASKPARVLC